MSAARTVVLPGLLDGDPISPGSVRTYPATSSAEAKAGFPPSISIRLRREGMISVYTKAAPWGPPRSRRRCIEDTTRRADSPEPRHQSRAAAHVHTFVRACANAPPRQSRPPPPTTAHGQKRHFRDLQHSYDQNENKSGAVREPAVWTQRFPQSGSRASVSATAAGTRCSPRCIHFAFALLSVPTEKNGGAWLPRRPKTGPEPASTTAQSTPTL